METFIYSAWFRDTDAFPDDQDHEWVACISIEARTGQEAQQWGDTLARERAERALNDVFLSSSVEPDTFEGDRSTLPRITVGERPTDETLGW